jgi:hypothetical protein
VLGWWQVSDSRLASYEPSYQGSLSTFLDRSRLAFAPPHTEHTKWDHVTPIPRPSESTPTGISFRSSCPPSRHRSGTEPATGEGEKASDRAQIISESNVVIVAPRAGTSFRISQRDDGRSIDHVSSSRLSPLAFFLEIPPIHGRYMKHDRYPYASGQLLARAEAIVS